MAFSVGVAYNLKSDCPKAVSSEAEDECAEYEEKETVDRIIKALTNRGHRVIRLPYGPGLLGKLQRNRPDIVFNIAEGWEGRNREAIVPAMLEWLGIPYTGSDPLTLSATLDKATAKLIVSGYGIPTPRFVKVSSLKDLAKVDLPFPLFVKPDFEGSSKGIRESSKVTDNESLERMVGWILTTYHQPVIVEEFLPGREFTVGIIGNEELRIFPIMEIRPLSKVDPEGFVYSYETKHNNLEEFICPADIPEDLAGEIRDVAQRAYRALECRDFARIDVRLDASGRPNFLEANPLPGLSPVSLFPVAAMADGISFEDLVNEVLDLAVKRYSLLAGHLLESQDARYSSALRG